MVARARPYRVQHDGLFQTTLGGNLDGLLPGGGLDSASEAQKPGYRVWNAHASGGKFDWNDASVNPSRSNGNNSAGWELRTVLLNSAAAFSYTMSLSDGTTDILWKTSVSASSSFVCSDRLFVPPNLHLKIVTSGAAAAVTAIAFAQPEHDSTRR